MYIKLKYLEFLQYYLLIISHKINNKEYIDSNVKLVMKRITLNFIFNKDTIFNSCFFYL